jgi:hypothetical protein
VVCCAPPTPTHWVCNAQQCSIERASFGQLSTADQCFRFFPGQRDAESTAVMNPERKRFSTPHHHATCYPSSPGGEVRAMRFQHETSTARLQARMRTSRLIGVHRDNSVISAKLGRSAPTPVLGEPRAKRVQQRRNLSGVAGTCIPNHGQGESARVPEWRAWGRGPRECRATRHAKCGLESELLSLEGCEVLREASSNMVQVTG